ncbi:hypothetical protein [Mucilaginibacter dorajii]|uniref:Lipoprotein n=1 Tax=Mucilaginibacter dorajii TaxID=692994 RepID=A0ABP7Q052_9SPHI|nr:hypothetical protein [Mucilaginibacter dorajii]MCS3737983.1 hypothetical protein [Mucilaginibacter dorajii]
MKTSIGSIILLSAALLAGCRGGLSGTYKQTGGLMAGMASGKMTFVSGNKVDIEINGVTSECTYEKDGDQVKLISGDRNQVLAIDKEGCLDGGEIMGKFCKEK